MTSDDPDQQKAATALYHLHAVRRMYDNLQHAMTRLGHRIGKPDDLPASEGGTTLSSYLAAIDDEVTNYATLAAFPNERPEPFDGEAPEGPDDMKHLLNQIGMVQLASNDVQVSLHGLSTHLTLLRDTGVLD